MALDEIKRSTEAVRRLQGQLQVVCAWTKRINVEGRWIALDEFLTNELNTQDHLRRIPGSHAGGVAYGGKDGNAAERLSFLGPCVFPLVFRVVFGLRQPRLCRYSWRTNMAKALTKSQIVASVAETVGITKKQAGQVFEAIVALAYKNAKNSFTLPGLGKLVLVNRKARMGRNPATGEQIKIPAKRVVKFRVAKAAKDAILGTK